MYFLRIIQYLTTTPLPMKKKVHNQYRKAVIICEYACGLNSSIILINKSTKWRIFRQQKNSETLITVGNELRNQPNEKGTINNYCLLISDTNININV